MKLRSIYLYRGYHSHALFELLQSAWEKNQLVILLPPQVSDFAFIQSLKHQVEAVIPVGEWPTTLKDSLNTIINPEQAVNAGQATVLARAVLGVFTSGTTTGIPRLIFYSKENVLSSLNSIRKLFDNTRLKNIYVYPQPTHCFGLVLGYMQAIIFNLKIHFHEGPYSKAAHEKWLHVVDENTLSLGAPVHFLDLIDFSVGKRNFKKSYSAIVGGALVTKKLWLQLKTDLLIDEPSVGYGGTEASPGVTHLPPGVEPEVDGDIGYTLDCVKLTATSEHVKFSGPNACLAILENGKMYETKEIILNDLLIFKVDSTGHQRAQFICRSDLLVNRGGQKISLEAVAVSITNHFNCKCMAISFYDSRLQEDIALVIEPKIYDEEIDVAKLQQQVLKTCGFKIPTANIILETIPLNANNKYDRIEALKLFLRPLDLKFPVPAAYVKSFLPHAGPAVWIDTLLKTEKNYSLTETMLKTDSPYFVNGRLTESSLIEFVAQSYGYMLALNDVLKIQPVKAATVTLIAEVKDSEFYFNSFDILPKAGDFIQVEVIGTHDFGNLKLVKGKVTFAGRMLANLSMKLYCS